MKKSVKPAKKLAGTLTPPADKSVSHRAAILNSLAPGEAMINNFSDGGDCRSTLQCLNLLGVTAEKITPEAGSSETPTLRLSSPGLEHFHEPNDILNAGNSGTTMRFILGLLGSTPFTSVVTGDGSLRSRPMARIVQPLRFMGAHIMGRNGDSLAPLTIRGGELNGIEYTLPVASAQVKSSLIMAALFAKGDTILHQPALSRDHTERMLGAMGANIVEDGLVLVIKPGSDLKPLNVNVSGDISSAAFWMVAAAAHPNASVKLTNVGVNPTRAAVLDILKAMGGRIKVENQHLEGGELVADILIESSDLHGVEIAGDQIPIVQDEIPVIALAACFAKGTTVIRDAQELRIKESDRLQTTAKELSRLGGNVKELPDGLIIEGTGSLKGGICRSYGDHRIAMTLGIAGLLADEEVVINGAEIASITYPNFWENLNALTTA
jgi:3-phosphoshikimate 1-carboxyvinyltransferase